MEQLRRHLPRDVQLHYAMKANPMPSVAQPVARLVDGIDVASAGEVFLVTDGGLHHHLAASGDFGRVIRKNYPVAIGNKMLGASRETATVVGNLCTPLNLLGDKMDLAHAEPGDLVVIFQSGAYGLTASPTAFLGHPAPTEVLV